MVGSGICSIDARSPWPLARTWPVSTMRVLDNTRMFDTWTNAAPGSPSIKVAFANLSISTAPLRQVLNCIPEPFHAPTARSHPILSVFCQAFAVTRQVVDRFSEFNVKGQKLYLSVCMDLYNGEIIAHQMARRSSLRAGFQHAAGSALADRVHRGTNRSLGPRLAPQDAALLNDACAAWGQAMHEPQGQLL